MAWLDGRIDTERLTLRPLDDEDRPVVERLLTCEDTRAYLGGPVAPDEVERRLARPLADEWGQLAITEKPAGITMGTVMLSRDRGELQVSWQLLPEHRGLGYATEAVAAVLSWAFGTFDDQEIAAVIPAADRRSIRLAERLGMRQSRVLQESGELQLEFRLRAETRATA